jgi:hypothetical protein
MAQNKYTFLSFAEEVLQVVPKPLTFQEIWSTGEEKGLVSKLASIGKTPWQSLGSRLFVDIRDNPDTIFIKVGKNPTRFFLVTRKTELTEEDLKDIANTKITLTKKDNGLRFHERQLHPLLAYFQQFQI